jgi:hypothetical protein
MKIPNQLEFKGNTIEAHENHEGFEIIVTYYQPDPCEVGSYIYYIRNSSLEIVVNSYKDRSYAEESVEKARLSARFTIENYLYED